MPKLSESAAPLYDRLVVHVMRTTGDGKTSELGRVERPLADYRNLPISLLVRKSRAADEMADGSPEEFETRLDVGTDHIALPRFNLDCSEDATCISRDWMDLELEGPGVPSRHVDRMLFQATNDAQEPPAFRRYTIVVVPGKISRQDVRQRVVRALGGEAIAQGKAEMEALQADAGKAASAQRSALLARADNLDRSAVIGHLIALEHAAESDAATDRLAQTLGVTVQRPVPRILITTEEIGAPGDSASLSLDLRLDDVSVASNDPGAVRLFQYARGIQESEIEGAVLAAVTGSDHAVSTAILMHAAAANDVGLMTVSPHKRNDLDPLDLPDDVASLVKAALDRGHDVVLPREAVDVAGTARWGFWEIDPTTSAVVGVMQGGEHQAMVEGPLMTRRVALNSKVGYVLGLMEGSIAFQWSLSSAMLRYGEITPAALAEVQEQLKTIACTNPCNFKASASAGAEVEVSLASCKKTLAKSLSVEGEINPTDDFCDSYKDGFECAVGALLASQGVQPDVSASVRIGKASVSIACFNKGIDAGGSKRGGSR